MQTKQCLLCGKTIIKPQNESQKNWETRHKYCSKSCLGNYRSRFEGFGKKTQFQAGQKAINPIKKGQHLSPRTQFKRDDVLGKKNRNWKGDNVSYVSLHTWLSRNYTKESCEHCGESKKRLDWANISKKYYRDRKDFLVLCRKCHYHYDRD